MRGARGAHICLAAAMAAGLLAGCGGGKSVKDAATNSTTTEVASACEPPPVTMALQSGGDDPVGSAELEVVDAVARRVAILPGDMAFDPATLSSLESKAAITPLAAFSLNLADFEIDRTIMSGTGPGELTIEDGDTLGIVTLVPATEAGFAEGDVVTDGELGYESRSELVPLRVVVMGADAGEPMASTDVVGKATILQLNEQTICVDLDITVEDDGEMVYRVKGAVSAPVVRASSAYFLN